MPEVFNSSGSSAGTSVLSGSPPGSLTYRGCDEVVPGVGRQPGVLRVLGVGEEQPDHQGGGGQVADCQ